MIAGRVVGTVVCTRKDEKLVGAKLLVVQPVNILDMAADGKPLVAVDSVGAGQVRSFSSCRAALPGKPA